MSEVTKKVKKGPSGQMLILEVTPHVCNKPIKIWELPEIGDWDAFTQLTQLPKGFKKWLIKRKKHKN